MVAGLRGNEPDFYDTEKTESTDAQRRSAAHCYMHEWSNDMKFLSDIEVIGGFWRFGNLLYCRTSYDCFFYGERTANKLVWRFYWLSKRPRIGI